MTIALSREIGPFIGAILLQAPHGLNDVHNVSHVHLYLYPPLPHVKLAQSQFRITARVCVICESAERCMRAAPTEAYGQSVESGN